MKSRQKRNKGFTLVELLAVILIIGILAAIAVPQYFKVIERSRGSEANAFLAAIKGAQERYFAKNGEYAVASAQSAAEFQTTLNKLDIIFPADSTNARFGMKFFKVSGWATQTCSDNSKGYLLTLTRDQAISGGAKSGKYGDYAIQMDRCAGSVEFTACEGAVDGPAITSSCDTDLK